MMAALSGLDISEGWTIALMAIAAPNTSTTTTMAPGTGQSYGAPLATVTTLFFMWGFLTCLNDILVPHLKSIFDLNYTQSQLIQFAFFGAYFVFSMPSAKLVDWMGYQKSMVVGPADHGTRSVPVRAGSECAVVSVISGRAYRACGRDHVPAGSGESLCHGVGQAGDGFESAESDASVQLARHDFWRLISVELLILSAAPKAMDEIRAMAPDALQAYRLHEAASVKIPYVGLGIALVVLAVAIGSFKLPKIAHAQHKVGEKVNDSIWKHPNLIFGAIAIFVYVGGEVSIGSFLVNYFSSARDWWPDGESCGQLCYLLLGRRDGRPLHRIGDPAKSEYTRAAWPLRGVRGCLSGDLDADDRALRDVQHHPGWILQFDHVPEHLYVGSGRTGAADGRWFRHHDHGNCWRSDYSGCAGSDCRSDRHSSRVLPAGALLSVHFVLCVERVEAEQRTVRQSVDRARHCTRVRKVCTITDKTRRVW